MSKTSTTVNSAGAQPSFSIDVIDDSLEGAHIIRGDQLVCRRTQRAQDGDLVVVQCGRMRGRNVYVRFMFRDDGRIRLEPANSAHRTVEYHEGKVRVVGVVSSVLRSTQADTPQPSLKKFVLPANSYVN